jgi:hypothetical protein
MITNVPIALVLHAKEQDLLNTPGCKRLNPIATDLEKVKQNYKETYLLQ